MNAKKCKKLREIARAGSIGRAWEAYVRRPGTGEIRLLPLSGKGIYRALKKKAV